MIARSVHKDSHLLLTKIESMNKENPNVISDYTCKFYTEQGKEEGVGPKSERLKAGTRIKVKLNSDLSPNKPSKYRYSGVDWIVKSSEAIKAGQTVKVINLDVGVLLVTKANK